MIFVNFSEKTTPHTSIKQENKEKKKRDHEQNIAYTFFFFSITTSAVNCQNWDTHERCVECVHVHLKKLYTFAKSKKIKKIKQKT